MENLRNARRLVEAKFGKGWYREPRNPNDNGFYRAKEFLRDYLGCIVMTHQDDNELLAFIDGEMQSVAIE